MAEGRIRRPIWSAREIAEFNAAWQDMQRKTPAIVAAVDEFTKANGRGLVGAYEAEERKWGALAVIKVEDRTRKVAVPEWFRGRASLKQIDTLLMEPSDISTVAEFAGQLGERFGFRVQREERDRVVKRPVGVFRIDIGENTPIYVLGYRLTPHFKH